MVLYSVWSEGKKLLTIVSALAFALSVVHLAYDDFCRLTPEEFGAVCDAWHENREATLHDEWERMRLLATITIQPHVKGKLSPQRLLPFPWEREKTKKTSLEDRPVTREEDRRRLEALMRRMER